MVAVEGEPLARFATQVRLRRIGERRRVRGMQAQGRPAARRGLSRKPNRGCGAGPRDCPRRAESSRPAAGSSENSDLMEDRFGTDFSQVRVHSDARAAESAGGQTRSATPSAPTWSSIRIGAIPIPTTG